MVDATAQSVGVEQASNGARADEFTTTAGPAPDSFPELVRAHYAWEKAGCWRARRPSATAPSCRNSRRRKATCCTSTGRRSGPRRSRSPGRSAPRITKWFSDHDDAHPPPPRHRLARPRDPDRRPPAPLRHARDQGLGGASRELGADRDAVDLRRAEPPARVHRALGRPRRPEDDQGGLGGPDGRADRDRALLRAGCDEGRPHRLLLGHGRRRLHLRGSWGSGSRCSLWLSGEFNQPQTLATQTFFVCFVMGTLGAFVSVLMRMSSN